MIQYSGFDPVALSVGPLSVRWYGLMYLIGFAMAWMLARSRAKKPEFGWKVEWVDDLIFYGSLGLILGARIGYILFYNFSAWMSDPVMLVRIWEGGMSFHGGFLGLLLAIFLYGRKIGKSFFEMTDFTAPLAPLGICAGRIGNFINGELWGKPTDVPWAFVVDGVARHPSQLYEAILEGVALFLIVWTFSSRRPPTMAVSGMFLVCYGIFRFSVEFVRLPDAHIGYLAFGWLTMGQILTSPMILLGIALFILAYRRSGETANG